MKIIWKLGAKRASFYVGIEREFPLFSYRINAAEMTDEDAAWRKIIYSIQIKLPAGYEVK